MFMSGIGLKSFVYHKYKPQTLKCFSKSKKVYFVPGESPAGVVRILMHIRRILGLNLCRETGYIEWVSCCLLSTFRQMSEGNLKMHCSSHASQFTNHSCPAIFHSMLYSLIYPADTDL
jgi:hypothetical protein